MDTNDCSISRGTSLAGRMRIECPDAPGASCVCIWSANAVDQIEALIGDVCRENEVFRRRLTEIANGECLQPSQHAAAAFIEVESR